MNGHTKWFASMVAILAALSAVAMSYGSLSKSVEIQNTTLKEIQTELRAHSDPLLHASKSAQEDHEGRIRTLERE